MSHKLINLNSDLKRLWEEGYEIEIMDAFMLISHVPYLTVTRTVKYGTMVTNLDLAGDQTLRPVSHVAYFIGEIPCHANGIPLDEIIISRTPLALHEKIAVELTFSSKPAVGYYDNYYHKIVTYINILANEAKFVDPTANERTYQVSDTEGDGSSFNYCDTNSARAAICAISSKVKGMKIAIIGTGGTGSYILDFVAKTPVAEIHIFDGDIFSQHNAFRTPGAASLDELRSRISKVVYLAGIYSAMHKNVIPHAYPLRIENIAELAEFDFVFLCVDDSTSKQPIILYLEKMEISFIDVGMGIQVVNGQLIGVLRTTSSTPEKRDHIYKNGRITFEDDDKNEYNSNIQIAELNAMNAALAVIKWKKLYGIYHDAENEYHSTYTVNESQLLNDDIKT